MRRVYPRLAAGWHFACEDLFALPHFQLRIPAVLTVSADVFLVFDQLVLDGLQSVGGLRPS